MIKVLIIDDEIWVCQLIRKLIDWEKAGFEVIGEAHDGFQGMELIRKMQPQLVLTDIRMPGIDGVELIRRTREMDLDTQFIIISGHSDFTYAQEALRYGALGYILKPIEQEELLEFLKRVREKIFTSATEEKEKQELKSRLVSSLGQLKEQYFRSVFREESQELFPAGELNRRYGCRFREGVFRVLFYQLDRAELRNFEMNEIMLTSLSRYFTNVFAGSCYDTFIFYENQRLLQILNYAEEESPRIRKLLQELPKKVNDEQKLEVGVELTIGAGKEKDRAEFLGDSFREARECVCLRLRRGVGNLIEAGPQKYRITERKTVFTADDEQRVEDFLQYLDVNKIRGYLHEKLSELLQKQEVAPSLLLETARQTVQVFLRTLKKNGITQEQFPEEWKKVDSQLENCYQDSQLEECVMNVFIQAQERFELGEKNRNGRMIAIVKHYIAEHYQEDISLKVLADQVCLNPKYFGEFFKKETGMNYSDYLTKYRIETAERLLKDVRNRVSEVGELVGYKDSKYFSKLFKKMTGLSPAQYRKMFS